MPDYECSWWPDVWFGHSLTQCCVVHDTTGTDFELYECVRDTAPGFIVLAVVMYVGVKLFRPVYRAYMARR